jgi:hypothetical protein
MRRGLQKITGTVFVIGAITFHEECNAQRIATLTVSNVFAERVPAYIDLDKLTSQPDSLISLIQVKQNHKKAVPFQVEHGYHRFLWWVPQKNTVYKLVAGKGQEHPALVDIKKDNGELLITNNGKPLLQYNFKTVYPPQGVDSVFKRSGFIHPLWSPAGIVLTRISPPDHRHHFGVWNPWTKVLFEGKEVDFWNLYKKEGTVRFAKFLDEEEGQIFAGFRALQEHVVLNDPHGEKVAMNEVWDVRAFPVNDKMWICDFTAALTCATNSPVTLQEYRYGGFGFRATGEWNDDNSKVLTSANKTRKDTDASTARWCMIDGDIKSGHSGVLFMSYPSNYNFPEPMRVWPEKMNKRGDVFFSFSPTRNKDWPLVPGESYVLKYRMLIYDGTITKERAEAEWKSFANPPQVKITNAK